MKSALVALMLPFGASLVPMVLTAFRSVKEYLDSTAFRVKRPFSGSSSASMASAGSQSLFASTYAFKCLLSRSINLLAWRRRPLLTFLSLVHTQ
jgi:hypothetical protein